MNYIKFPSEGYQIDIRKHQVKQLQNEIKELQAEIPFVCPNCDHHNITKDSTLHLYEYYIPPYSCEGGDFYTVDKHARVQCTNCQQYMQFERSTVHIPWNLFANVETHQTGG